MHCIHIFYPGKKSEEFLQVLQFWWLVLKIFREISREQVLVSDSWEILRNWSPILEIFKGSEFWELISRNSWNFLLKNFLEYFSGNSSELSGIFPRHISGIILRKFLRNSQDLVTNFMDFLGELNQRHSLEKFWEFLWNINGEIPENFYEIFLWKFLKYSQILVTNFMDFLGNWIKDIDSRNYSEFLENFSWRNSWEFL